MRTQGVVDRPVTARSADHLCWVHDDAGAFAPVARRFLTEGLDRGERLLCIGEDAVAAARPLPGLAGLLERGALELLPLGEAYRGTARFVPEEQLAYYEAATRRALADGYRGLRVLADVTALAADGDRRAELLRWEHLADDFIAHGPGMSAMCAYRAPDLPADVVADVASVHPAVRTPGVPPPFRVWFEDGGIALAGEIDACGVDRLRRVLAASGGDRPVLTADLSRVGFVDVAGCRLLAAWARDLRARSARLELTGTSRLFRRTWQLLGLDDLAGDGVVAP